MSVYKWGTAYVYHLESVCVPNILNLTWKGRLVCQTKWPPPQSRAIVVVKVATRGWSPTTFLHLKPLASAFHLTHSYGPGSPRNSCNSLSVLNSTKHCWLSSQNHFAWTHWTVTQLKPVWSQGPHACLKVVPFHRTSYNTHLILSWTRFHRSRDEK